MIQNQSVFILTVKFLFLNEDDTRPLKKRCPVVGLKINAQVTLSHSIPMIKVPLKKASK